MPLTVVQRNSRTTARHARVACPPILEHDPSIVKESEPMKTVLLDVEKSRASASRSHRCRGLSWHQPIRDPATGRQWPAVERTPAELQSTPRQARSVPARQGRFRCRHRTRQGTADALISMEIRDHLGALDGLVNMQGIRKDLMPVWEELDRELVDIERNGDIRD